MAKSSSKPWLHRHITDSYVRKAKEKGYRSRAAFKLLEIDDKEKLLKPGAIVLDLGAAPGGWSQVAAQRVRPGGSVLAIDILDMAPIPGVTFQKGDFGAIAFDGRADVVLCDVSPNISGIRDTDQARVAELVERAAALARERLAPGGAFLVKTFHGGRFPALLEAMKRGFRTVQVCKPGASRSESRETYLLARGPKPS
ncbi:MAG: rRNA (uridine2552-2-O)-methyltransferase [Betaproteobacteria bacterium]|nr:rRNA (uridine2552-2-O)-methyltransferase [Betaproteobacteria bacterium]